jgi:hypothetical protein
MGLRWLFDLVSESWWPNGHEFKSHHSHLFDKKKNQAQGNVCLYKFQAQKTFTWGGILENNINHILKHHLKLKLLGWDGSFTL